MTPRKGREARHSSAPPFPEVSSGTYQFSLLEHRVFALHAHSGAVRYFHTKPAFQGQPLSFSAPHHLHHAPDARDLPQQPAFERAAP